MSDTRNKRPKLRTLAASAVAVSLLAGCQADQPDADRLVTTVGGELRGFARTSRGRSAASTS
jgi:hypothetical protein